MNKSTVTKKLESFNNKCLRCILGITKAQQRTGRITSAEVRRRFGVEEMLEDVIAAKRLCWAGHVAHMEDCHLPKRLMFGRLPHTEETCPWNQATMERQSEERSEAV